MSNIKDVAKQAGVSISTVSHVLNKTKYVSPELVQKVEDAVKKLKYEVNPIARSMKSNKLGVVGIITEDLCGVFYPYVIKGVASVLSREGYQMMVCDITGEKGHAEEQARETALFKSLVQSRVDGIIFVTMIPEEKQKSYCSSLLKITREPKIIPLVSIERNMSRFGIDSVYFDSYENARKAVLHLIDCGCRKIVHITGPLSMEIAAERTASYRDVMKEQGLDQNIESMIANGDYSHQSGYKAMKYLIENVPDLDGVFCANDQMAVGALKALKKLNRRVPEEIKVIGYDDVFVSSIVEPALSTVHIQKFHAGAKAAELLLDQIKHIEEGKRRNPVGIKMESRLVIRRSTRLDVTEDGELPEW